MPETFQDNRIAVGHNNVAGLVNIESIAVEGRYFTVVDDVGKWNHGVDVLYGDGLAGTQGIASTTWVCGHITLAQYDYIYTTLLGGSISGRVTIRTCRHKANTYANYNAVLTIASPNKLNKRNGVFTDFVWSFTGLTLIQ